MIERRNRFIEAAEVFRVKILTVTHIVLATVIRLVALALVHVVLEAVLGARMILRVLFEHLVHVVAVLALRIARLFCLFLLNEEFLELLFVQLRIALVEECLLELAVGPVVRHLPIRLLHLRQDPFDLGLTRRLYLEVGRFFARFRVREFDILQLPSEVLQPSHNVALVLAFGTQHLKHKLGQLPVSSDAVEGQVDASFDRLADPVLELVEFTPLDCLGVFVLLRKLREGATSELLHVVFQNGRLTLHSTNFVVRSLDLALIIAGLPFEIARHP